MLAGAAFGLTGLPLPALVGTPLAMLGQSAIPLSLIVLGMGLAEYGIRSGWREATAITAIKLLVQPLVAEAKLTLKVVMPKRNAKLTNEMITATGSVNSAIAPRSTIMRDSTDAKIGRRMKKWENFTAGGPGYGFAAGAAAGEHHHVLGGEPGAVERVVVVGDRGPQARMAPGLRIEAILGGHLDVDGEGVAGAPVCGPPWVDGGQELDAEPALLVALRAAGGDALG